MVLRIIFVAAEIWNFVDGSRDISSEWEEVCVIARSVASSLPKAQRTGHAGTEARPLQEQGQRNGTYKDKVKRTGLKTRRYKGRCRPRSERQILSGGD
jgi:hypothetical protein